MSSEPVLTGIRPSGIGEVTLNRPDVHNAFDETTIAELTAALRSLDADKNVRIVILAASGKSFSAGADLNWMRRTAKVSKQENRQDALALAELMRALDTLSKPSIAKVHGAAFGGGVGLVACADIAIAAEEAVFSLSEVRLGLTPAVISPYVVRALGARQARRYFLTAERFSAAEAKRIGLVHEVVPRASLSEEVEKIAEALLQGGPAALGATKALIAKVYGRVDDGLIRETADLIASVRASPEGREGVAAFLQKRKPEWRS